ncbi:hypothetical protein APS56_01975 [Pseudalgibacter alginicilyticus]|uniref:Lipoprotein n=1 Tax=Pseudalgibacter alginicilyticus TaxID=1736674 RepID=A0A0P0CDA9_9FLAO|nr:hypothetical protein [Pseudalgibacter alginicilyticus]ALJ03995.1 hypothetical protein APS56_01975 [Pseudalgibacter alginicilyticus]
MKKIILPLLAIIVTLVSCNKTEMDVFDEPFVHINFNDVSTVNINSNRKDIVSYYIYLSSKPLDKDMLLDYSIIIGDGLQEGVDFNILTTEFPLTFPSGIYRRPIQIQWLEHVLDPSKNNTITIKLNSNNLGITVGFPGPDANQSELILQKVNS